MNLRRLCKGLSVCLAALMPLSAASQVVELRIGVTEFDERSLRLGPSARAADENSLAINGEILFDSPDMLKWAFAPYPYIGGTVNLEGKTSYGGAGLLWRKDFNESFYGDLSVGVVAHNGTTEITDFFQRIKQPRDQIQLGSRLLFREQIALGYSLNSEWSAEVFYEHLSNAFLADSNEGADSLGMRAVKKF